MNSFDKMKYTSICHQGDYNKVVSYLTEFDDSHELLDKYKNIFEGDEYSLKTEDERINLFLRSYEDFLKWMLKTNPTTVEAENAIVQKLKPFFPSLGFVSKVSKKLAYALMYIYVPMFFKKHGYHAQFDTFDIYPSLRLWRNEVTRNEIVELPDGKVNMEVIEMDGIITRGWADYLSMGKTGTGGWVTKKGCTYFKEKYDTESDVFKVSLLKHEGQHFLDKKNHRKMKSTDLEFRAKLVELIYHNEMNTFFYFLQNAPATDDRSHPHFYAERKIIQGLSMKIFGTDWETSHEAWEAKRNEIPIAAHELLDEHSKKLVGWNGKSFVI